MKKYIYPVLLLTALMMGFTSCVDNFDEDDKATYPNRPSFGVWTNENTPSEGPLADQFNYEVTFTENIHGDSIVNISFFHKEAGLTLNSANGIISEYDPVAGMVVANFTSSELGYLFQDVQQAIPITAYMTYDRHAQNLRVNIDIYGNTYFYFNVAKSNYSPYIYGYWEDLATGIMLQLNSDGTAVIETYDEVMTCTFSYDRNKGTMVFYATEAENAEGEAAEPRVIATAYFNENSQLKFSLEGAEEVLMDRLAI